MRYCEVLIPQVPKPLTYSIPAEYDPVEGQLVLVPLGNRRAFGVVNSLKPDFIPTEIKPILETEPLVIPERMMELARWMSRYYLTPLSQTIRLFLPPGSVRMEILMVRAVRRPDEKIEGDVQMDTMGYLLQRKGQWVPVKTLRSLFGRNVDVVVRYFERKGWVELRLFMPHPRLEGSKINEFLHFLPQIELPTTPTDEQKNVIDEVGKALDSGQYATFLLHGVTGSGKTFVYMELAQKTLQQGRSVLVLVPEIGLTPQVAAMFIKKFGEIVGIYHSKFTAAERRWIWRNVQDGKIRIVIGPRSALFLPFRELGLIIVDEEHDTSYKQMEHPPLYHARDVAVVRGKMENSVVVLGSATPSAETYFNAIRKKYRYLEMRHRITGYYHPDVEIVDMKEVKSPGPLSPKLLEELEKTVTAGKQAILFLNRRGFAPHIQCLDCGHVFKCPHCSVTLTFHRKEKLLKCHLCGFEMPAPDICPACGSTRLKPIGTGTEKVEGVINRLLPNARILRMDMDTTRRKHAHEEIYARFKNMEAQVLIGTQMVVKGFDFPNVGLVGVVLADVGLNLPDFRAEERIFQLITQVIGRIRRGGIVIIQTYSPETPAIRHALKLDYHGFMKEELEKRREFGYPPFKRILTVMLTGRSRQKVIDTSRGFYEALTSQAPQGIEIYPPNPAPIEKIRGKYRYRIVIKYQKPYLAQDIISKMDFSKPHDVHIVYDVDPIDML